MEAYDPRNLANRTPPMDEQWIFAILIPHLNLPLRRSNKLVLRKSATKWGFTR